MSVWCNEISLQAMSTTLLELCGKVILKMF